MCTKTKAKGKDHNQATRIGRQIYMNILYKKSDIDYIFRKIKKLHTHHSYYTHHS